MTAKSTAQLWGEKFQREAKNLPVSNVPGLPDTRLLMASLLSEEFHETFNAIIRGDFIATLDGIGDLMFVCRQMLSACGIVDTYLDSEICTSNMTKFLAGHSFREDGKLIKSPLYSPPNIEWVIKQSRAALEGV